MKAELNLWIIFFIAAAAQGLFLSFILIGKNPSGRSSQNTLALLLFTFTLIISYYIVFWMGISKDLPIWLGIAGNLTYLLGPLVLKYAKQTQNEDIKSQAIHYLPFLLITLLILFQAQIPIVVFPILQIAHLLVYVALLYAFIKTKSPNKWLTKLLFAFSGYCLCFLAYYLLVWLGWLKVEYDYMVSLGMSVFIYFIGYSGYTQPNHSEKGHKENKYAKSNLTETALVWIEKKLDQKMEQEKLFTNGDLKLQDLADTLDVNLHGLSQTINVKKGKSFNDYLNELRVNEAKELLSKQENKEATLLAIAIDAGFNNKTSFLNAFKKFEGQPPSQYRKSILEKRFQ
tara:strand:- start:2559 stop:3587 length:1029 start_codon:yes stop_codon:yes gene_type:complete